MVAVEAIFTGANKQTQVSDYCTKREVVAFGAAHNVALWKPLDSSHKGVYATLGGHKAEVTCVKFIPNTDLLVSAAEDHTVKVWKFGDSCTPSLVQTIDHHTTTITTISVYNDRIFAIGSADGTVSLWIRDGDSYTFGQDIIVKKGFYPLNIAIENVESNKYVIAIGGTSVLLFVYSFLLDAAISELQQCAVLEGHEDWVKALAWTKQEDGDFMLASGSQDKYIRLWRLRTGNKIDTSDEDETKLTLLSNKQYKFSIQETNVAINFEALIMGHDDWISSLQWHKSKQQLLACSADTAVIIWEPDYESGIWVSTSRLGEMSTKGASTATGSSGGFWSCLWFEKDNKQYIMTNGKTGSWRMWASSDSSIWEPQLAISGATKFVTDIAWSGKYLLATSLDQTTRLYAQWNKTQSWLEFSRPQIHGYDMFCVEPLSETRFVSGGDEKILRSFDEPKGVAQLLNKFSSITVDDAEAMPESASLPALGLSNKATTDNSGHEVAPNERETNDNNNITYDILSELENPPLEDQLQRHTLWPEIEKLYGHGFEISCLDVSPDKKYIATACRSNTQQHAVVRIFDATTWLQLKPHCASFHNLTITRLKFSPNGDKLLSVSRDRQWAIWNTSDFSLQYSNEKPHTRIIWDCCWAPAAYGDAFVTASRDKSIKVWKFNGETYECEQQVKFGEPVTAIDIHKELTTEGELQIALGFESGALEVYNYKSELKLKEKVDVTPTDRINRVRWAPTGLMLGVASNDTTTRIYSF